MSLTIAYVTSRREPRIEWFFDSLARQAGPEFMNVIVVSPYDLPTEFDTSTFVFTNPKPTIWQGPHRLTREDWWAKSNALNTAIALCKTEWISFVDDRSVLEYRWLDRVKAAMEGGYAVCGYYEKRANMKVENGLIVDEGELLGADTRTPGNYPFDTLYGGHYALPLEWCLAVNGHSEWCDSLGLEDSLFGTTLRNNGYPMRYDSDLRLIEDRTPGQLDGALRRSDWGVSPNDASHALVDMLKDSRTSLNNYNLRELRESVLAGNPFPSPNHDGIHWYSGEKISDKFL